MQAYPEYSETCSDALERSKTLCDTRQHLEHSLRSARSPALRTPENARHVQKHSEMLENARQPRTLALHPPAPAASRKRPDPERVRPASPERAFLLLIYARRNWWPARTPVGVALWRDVEERRKRWGERLGVGDKSRSGETWGWKRRAKWRGRKPAEGRGWDRDAHERRRTAESEERPRKVRERAKVAEMRETDENERTVGEHRHKEKIGEKSPKNPQVPKKCAERHREQKPADSLEQPQSRELMSHNAQTSISASAT